MGWSGDVWLFMTLCYGVGRGVILPLLSNDPSDTQVSGFSRNSVSAASTDKGTLASRELLRPDRVDRRLFLMYIVICGVAVPEDDARLVA